MARTLVIVSDREGIEALRREEQEQRKKEGAIILGLIFLMLLNK